MFSIDFVLIVLVDKAVGTFLESCNGLVVPPLIQIAIFIIFTALIVKCMGKFMAHHDAHATKVQAFRIRYIIKWQLQYAGRKDNLIFGWCIVGIYRCYMQTEQNKSKQRRFRIEITAYHLVLPQRWSTHLVSCPISFCSPVDPIFRGSFSN